MEVWKTEDPRVNFENTWTLCHSYQKCKYFFLKILTATQTPQMKYIQISDSDQILQMYMRTRCRCQLHLLTLFISTEIWFDTANVSVDIDTDGNTIPTPISPSLTYIDQTGIVSFYAHITIWYVNLPWPRAVGNVIACSVMKDGVKWLSILRVSTILSEPYRRCLFRGGGGASTHDPHENNQCVFKRFLHTYVR